MSDQEEESRLWAAFDGWLLSGLNKVLKDLDVGVLAQGVDVTQKEDKKPRKV